MTEKELETMIQQDFLADTAMICIDAEDLKTIRAKSDFIDGGRAIVLTKELRGKLQSVLDELKTAHADDKLTHLAVKLLLSKEAELMMQEMAVLHEVFDTLQDIEIIWGIGSDEKLQNGEIAICVVAGFKRA